MGTQSTWGQIAMAMGFAKVVCLVALLACYTSLALDAEDGVVELKDDASTIAKKAAKAAGGGAAFQAELNSDKILPETRKEKDKAFGEAYTLTTYSSADCGGKATAAKTFRGCKGSPSLKECPKDMWTKAYTCKKTEKASDMVYSENWSWGVNNGQFLMRYESGGNTWKHLEPGKMAMADTCFQWLDDVQHVFLLQKLNAPSCKPINSFGQKEKLGESSKAGAGAFLGTSGSFKIVKAPKKPAAKTGPKPKSSDPKKSSTDFSGSKNVGKVKKPEA